jgi:predicted type IV restriction endonuclease
MTDSETTKLKEVIRDAAAKIQRFQDRGLGEENTKASLIEPILEALGWDIRDPDEVHREFKPTPQDKPVDYCLSLLRKPRLLVEAKGLGETLSDRKWIGQILGYATVAGVVWCVLTDGNEYRFYNASAPLDAEEKLFFHIKLSGGEAQEVAKTLGLVSRSDMQENLLEALWNEHYVDRRVRKALQDMFETRDKGLIRLIRKKATKLTPREVIESLRRLDIRVDSSSPIQVPKGKVPPSMQKKPRDESRPRKGTRHVSGVTLETIIGAGLLVPPLRLFRKYKGQMFEATLLSDGAVEFQGTRYESCSTAAEKARMVLTGRRMSTNGWDFWQFVDKEGKKNTLFDVRERFNAIKGEVSN